jgi:hypothetical protein
VRDAFFERDERRGLLAMIPTEDGAWVIFFVFAAGSMYSWLRMLFECAMHPWTGNTES